MNIPNNEIPEEMNWADYCDALSNERFIKAIYDRKAVQRPQPDTRGADDEESQLAKVESLP